MYSSSCAAIALGVALLAFSNHARTAESSALTVADPYHPRDIFRIRWRAKTPFERVINLYSLGDGLYVEGPNGEMLSVIKLSGAFRWRRELRYPADFPPVQFKDVIYVLSAGQLVALDHASGIEISRMKIPLGAVIKPLVTEEMALFASSEASVHGIALSTGKVAWTTRLDTNVNATATLGQDLFYALCEDGTVRCFLPRTGEPAWIQKLRRPAIVTPVVTPELIYVGCPDSSIHALQARTGLPVWKTSLGASVLIPPVLARNHLFVALRPDSVAALNPENGKTLWRVPHAQSLITTTPQRVYLRDSQGTILAADLKTGNLLSRLHAGHFPFFAAEPEEGAFYLVTTDGQMLAIEDAELARERELKSR